MTEKVCNYTIIKHLSKIWKIYDKVWTFYFFFQKKIQAELQNGHLETLNQGCSIRRSTGRLRQPASRSWRSMVDRMTLTKIGPPPCHFLYSAKIQQKHVISVSTCRVNSPLPAVSHAAELRRRFARIGTEQRKSHPSRRSIVLTWSHYK